ncbi:MAG TPA: hypothetical protein VGQ35_20920 [Dongiaceae bacterium]|nr:hypothetical protein [Dongiaceae bacterium]
MQHKSASILRVMRGGLVASLICCAVGAAAQAWERPHSDAAKSGFADVDTLAAERPATISGLGTFAPGAGPAIAADGTVYLGNKEGQLIALQPNGTRKWTQSITPGFSIVTSPVVDSFGAVYVVGTKRERNEQTDPPLNHWDSILYRFDAQGVLGWQNTLPGGFDGANVSATPNIWKIPNENDVVMLLADYHNRVTGGYETRLLAYATTGAMIGNINIKSVVYGATGSSSISLWCLIPPVALGCAFGADFNPSGLPVEYDPATKLPQDIVAPRPGAAIFTFPGGGTPFILVSNQFQELVAYTFAHRQFQEIFRVHDEGRVFLSPPMVMPDGHTVIATSGDKQGEIRFYGPNMNAWSPIKGPITNAPATRLADGRLVIVERMRQMTILNGKAVERRVPLPGESIAPAAASRNHVFVSTAGSFITYDPSTWLKQAEIFWVGGGQVTPAIGPLGHVYGMASNVLFVFPPPVASAVGPLVANPDGPLVADPTPPAATPAQKRFSGPLTTQGHRLFACQELDGDHCGGSTNQAIALAFCQQQGFTQAAKVDTETKKVKAARLDGQFCTKNKCKVFDEIVCKK